MALQISISTSAVHKETAYRRFSAHTLQVPVDHFHNDTLYEPHTNATFPLRYWFDASHDKGGPVFLLSGGETSGSDRLPFLEKGLIAQLAEATGGIAVVLEHRYYGDVNGGSYPTEDFSTENLRFLTTQQAMADHAFFANNVVFKGLEKYNATASHRPYIAYGGSYAGAFVAFLRVLYPETFWGAIASSAVTEAIYDYWQYFDPIIKFGDATCIHATQQIMHVIDSILEKVDNEELVQSLKTTWQLPNLTHIEDFLNLVSSPPAYWQGRNWDPEVSSPGWDNYCNALNNETLQYAETKTLFDNARHLIAEGGHAKDLDSLITPMLNHIGYLNASFVSRCRAYNQDECFSSFNHTFYQLDDLNQQWRLWPYQYCTQWGYLQTGSGVPEDRLPLISRHIDLEYSSMICREAFNITGPPDLESINQYGGFDIAYDRLAFVDGEQDPWRLATPHAWTVKDRENTVNRPFLLIEGGVHHWDENGVYDSERRDDFPPAPVSDVQASEKHFIHEWVKDWHKMKAESDEEEYEEL